MREDGDGDGDGATSSGPGDDAVGERKVNKNTYTESNMKIATYPMFVVASPITNEGESPRRCRVGENFGVLLRKKQK